MYFESIGSASAVAGADGDDFITQSKAAGAQAIAHDSNHRLGGETRSGPSEAGQFFPWRNTARNNQPILISRMQAMASDDGANVTGNDPNDANQPADSAFQLGWFQHLTNRWGRATNGGLRYYVMDNEPSIWFSTHRDVHPTARRWRKSATR